MSASGYIGDHHPGQYLPFWQQACAANTRTACEDLYFQEDGYCEDGSAWACNEVGILLAEHYANPRRAVTSFERACRLQFEAGCNNGVTMETGGSTFKHDPPTLADYPFILTGSKGPLPEREREPARLSARACDQGWPGACGVQ